MVTQALWILTSCRMHLQLPSVPLDSVEWDTEDTQGDANTQKFGLIRFENIFGGGAGQIPAGSTIVSAGLQYTVFNYSASPDANVNGVLVDWTESVTWNTFGATAGVRTRRLWKPGHNRSSICSRDLHHRRPFQPIRLAQRSSR